MGEDSRDRKSEIRQKNAADLADLYLLKLKGYKLFDISGAFG